MSRGGKIAQRFTKATLPSKLCEGCARPFNWRKAWARDWDQVRYCSDRCRATAKRISGAVREHGAPK